MAKARVVVVGSGIIGLTTAIRLREAGYEVLIVTGSWLGPVTSHVAAAFWYPFAVGQHDEIWAMETYHRLKAHSEIRDSGVVPRVLEEYFEDAERAAEFKKSEAWWRHMRGMGLDFRSFGETLEVQELPNPHGRPFRAGIRFKTFVADMPRYLHYLQKWVQRIGVEVHDNRTLNHLTEAFDFDCSVVINCAGIGAMMILTDEEDSRDLGVSSPNGRTMDMLHPAEGQIVRVKRPEGFDRLVLVHTGSFATEPLYIVARIDDVVLGGTIDDYIPPLFERDPALAWSLPQPKRRIQARILREARTLCPELPTDVLTDQALVGFRPARGRVRVDFDPWYRENDPDVGKPVIHNYGHGGSGLTLSWGCASRVVDYVRYFVGE